MRVVTLTTAGTQSVTATDAGNGFVDTKTGVVVVPVTQDGQATIQKATGAVKPIEHPSTGDQS